jgi:hypothetical protein
LRAVVCAVIPIILCGCLCKGSAVIRACNSLYFIPKFEEVPAKWKAICEWLRHGLFIMDYWGSTTRRNFYFILR